MSLGPYWLLVLLVPVVSLLIDYLLIILKLMFSPSPVDIIIEKDRLERYVCLSLLATKRERAPLQSMSQSVSQRERKLIYVCAMYVCMYVCMCFIYNREGEPTTDTKAGMNREQVRQASLRLGGGPSQPRLDGSVGVDLENGRGGGARASQVE